MIRRIVLGAAAVALSVTGVLAAPAHAGGCDTIFLTQAVGPVYVDVRSDGDVWVYLDDNGVFGLQRGGSGGVTGQSATDACSQSGDPDTIIF